MSGAVLLVCFLGLLMTLLLGWGFRALPTERWQIMATVPHHKQSCGSWSGTNITYYGLILACAAAFGGATFLFLLASLEVSTTLSMGFLGAIMAVALPAARLVALIVERQRHTFTVGGASFVGLLAVVPVVAGLSVAAGRPAWELVLPTLAAASCGFLFGEGLGRLGCISFGCCYGKPVRDLPPRLRRLFSRRFHFDFRGETKKIAYASGLAGEPVVPIQAMTSTVYVVAGLVGVLCFLQGYYGETFVGLMTLAHGWRVFSETLRADYRGGGKISKYQIMGAVAVVYGWVVYAVFSEPALAAPQVVVGLGALWAPSVILALQGLWLAVFLATGWSTVTGSVLSFHVHEERVRNEAPAPAPVPEPLPLPPSVIAARRQTPPRRAAKPRRLAGSAP